MRAAQVGDDLGVGDVGLGEHQLLGKLAGVDLAEHRAHRLDPALGVGVARIDQVQHEVGVGHLLEGGPERLDQLVGQAAHEADRVGQQHRLATGQPQPADGRVEGGEQAVLDEDGRRR